MKTGWESKPLGDLLSVLRNGVNCKQDRSGDGYKISRIESIANAAFDLQRVGYALLSDREKERFRLHRGDILFSHINSPVHVGKTAIFDCDEEVYHGVNLLLMRPSDELIPSYLELSLKYLFQSGYWLRVCKQSVNQASVNQRDISRVEIRFPTSLAEQQRIVRILDEAFAGLATAEANAARNLQNAREIFDSHLHAVFSQPGEDWVEKRLSDLCVIKHGYAFDGTFFSNQGDYVLLTPGNFYESGGYRDRGDKQKYYTGHIPRDFVLTKGNLLVAMTEQAVGLLGSPILVPESDKFLHNQRLGLVTAKPGEQWLNEFFFHVFNLAAVRQAIQDSASGTKVRHTSPTKIGAVPVWFPPVAEQKRIVTQLDGLAVQTQKLTRLYEQKQAALSALKTSLLHEAFSGEL